VYFDNSLPIALHFKFVSIDETDASGDVFIKGILLCLLSYKINNLFIVAVKHKHYIQGVPGGKDNILGGHSIDHSKQKALYEHVSYSERFPR
jgi:hypothetical protein